MSTLQTGVGRRLICTFVARYFFCPFLLKNTDAYLRLYDAPIKLRTTSLCLHGRKSDGRRMSEMKTARIGVARAAVVYIPSKGSGRFELKSRKVRRHKELLTLEDQRTSRGEVAPLMRQICSAIIVTCTAVTYS